MESDFAEIVSTVSRAVVAPVSESANLVTECVADKFDIIYRRSVGVVKDTVVGVASATVAGMSTAVSRAPRLWSGMSRVNPMSCFICLVGSASMSATPRKPTPCLLNLIEKGK